MEIYLLPYLYITGLPEKISIMTLPWHFCFLLKMGKFKDKIIEKPYKFTTQRLLLFISLYIYLIVFQFIYNVIFSFLIELRLYWAYYLLSSFPFSLLWHTCAHTHSVFYNVVSISDYTKNKWELLTKIVFVFPPTIRIKIIPIQGGRDGKKNLMILVFFCWSLPAWAPGRWALFPFVFYLLHESRVEVGQRYQLGKFPEPKEEVTVRNK